MSEEQLVRVETPTEGVALVTLSDPHISSHVSFAGASQLASALEEARESGARISVLASGVPGHWYEHAWLPDLQALMAGKAGSGEPAGWFRALREITDPRVVTIAAISGDCSGGGAELGWACDLRIAEEQARIAQPEVMIGLATGVGGTCRLMRLIGRTATAEMVLDGGPLTARRLYELGGLNRVVPEGEAVEAAVEWAARLAARPPASLVALKQMLKDAEDLPLSDALANEQRLFQELAPSRSASEGMARIQARFDAGESVRDVYGRPRD